MFMCLVNPGQAWRKSVLWRLVNTHLLGQISQYIITIKLQ